MASTYPNEYEPYPEHDQIRDLQYLEQLPDSQKPDPSVVERLIAYDLIRRIDYTMRGNGMVYLTPRGGALVLKANS